MFSIEVQEVNNDFDRYNESIISGIGVIIINKKRYDFVYTDEAGLTTTPELPEKLTNKLQHWVRNKLINHG